MDNIHIIEATELRHFSYVDTAGIAVVMPCIDAHQGWHTAQILHRRAGMDCFILVVLDTQRQGFVKTLNQAVARLTVRYVVYLAQDAWPGRSWLKCGVEALEISGKALLAFNDGKWQGRIASFGLVRVRWATGLYNGCIFYSGYHSHAADNELTVIARAQDQHLYAPECTLVEVDPDKDFSRPHLPDSILFKQRFMRGFDGQAPLSRLAALAPEYKVGWFPGLAVIVAGPDLAQHLERFLKAFSAAQLAVPLEIVIVDRSFDDAVEAVANRWAHQVFVRLIQKARDLSLADAFHLAAQRTASAWLLFIHSQTNCKVSALVRALARLDRYPAHPMQIDLMEGTTPGGVADADSDTVTDALRGVVSDSQRGVLVPTYAIVETAWLTAHSKSRTFFFHKLARYLRQPAWHFMPPERSPLRPVLLYIIHDGAGGMVQIAQDLARQISVAADTYVLRAGNAHWELQACSSYGVTLLYTWHFLQEWFQCYDLDAERDQALTDILKRLQPDLVHIRVLLGTGPTLIERCKDQQVSVVLSFHDYSAVCPSLHLLHQERFCGGDCGLYTAEEADCRAARQWFGHITRLRPDFRRAWSEALKPALARCDAFVVTSAGASEIIQKNYPDLAAARFHLIEHGRNFRFRQTCFRPWKEGEVCNIFYYGALNEAKGALLVLEIIALNEQHGGHLHFHVLGNFFDAVLEARFAAFKTVTLYGQYEREALQNWFETLRPTLTLLPSLCHETFSHALTESWACGVPVLGTSLGAIGERLRRHGGGWTLPPRHPDRWYQRILEIIGDPHDCQRAVNAIQSLELKDVQQMTLEYMALYETCISLRFDRSALLTQPRPAPVRASAPVFLSPPFKQLSVTILRARLRNLGFHERAYSDLQRLTRSDTPLSQRQAAAWELALWHADHYTRADAEQCLKFLEICMTGDLTSIRGRQVAVLQAECWQILEQPEHGRAILVQALAHAPHSELYWGLASLAPTRQERLEAINHALALTHLAPLTVDIKVPAALDGLQGPPGLPPALLSSHQNPVVSIIVPAYNAEQTLGTALRSLGTQTWPYLEIIVVDDASTDATPEVARAAAQQDARIRLLAAPSNQGPYGARNLGLKAAQGQVVTCHDADDWSHPQKIAHQLQHLMAHPQAVATISRWARVFEDLRFYRRGNPGHYEQLNLSSLMFHRHPVMQHLGFWDSVRFGADTEFYYRVQKAFGVDALQETPGGILSLARSTPASLTENPVTGYAGYARGARKEYRDSFQHYHDQGGSLYYSFPQLTRPFPVPAGMQPQSLTNVSLKVDLAWISDFRYGDTAAQRNATLQSLASQGCRLALIPLYVYDDHPATRFHQTVRDLIDGDRIRGWVYGDTGKATLLLIDTPACLQEQQDVIPHVRPDQIVTLLNLKATPEMPPDPLILTNLAIWERRIQQLFGQSTLWMPLNACVRNIMTTSFASELPSDSLTPHNWADIDGVAWLNRQT